MIIITMFSLIYSDTNYKKSMKNIIKVPTESNTRSKN